MDTSDFVEVADSRARSVALFHGLGIVVAAFAVGIGLALGTVVVLSQFTTVYGPDGDLLPTAIAVSSVAQFVGFILTGIAYVEWRSDRSLIGVRMLSLRDVGLVVGGFVAIVATSVALSLVISLLGLQSAQNTVVTTGQENPEFFLYMIPISLLFVGPGEELLFRGIVQGLFKRAYGPAPAILITSLLFGVAHYLALTGSGKEVYIAIAATLGIVLGIAYEVSDNLVVPALIHGLWNAFLFVINWIATTQDIQQAMIVTWL